MRLLFLPLLIISFVSVWSNNEFLPQDTIVCYSESFSISNYSGKGFYNWSSPDLALNNTDSSTVYITPSDTGDFSLSLTTEFLYNNAVSDGMFEGFDESWNSNFTNANFETTYDIASENGTLITTPNSLMVNDTIFAWHESVKFCETNPDYYFTVDGETKNPRGKFLIGDAPENATETPNTVQFALANYVWQKTISIVPGFDYHFEFEISDWNANSPSDLMFLVDGEVQDLMIDGVAVGTIATTKDCEWSKVSGTWKSSGNTTATITISEVSNILEGHEFAIDNIAFYLTRGEKTETMSIRIEDCSIPDTSYPIAKGNTMICPGNGLKFKTSNTQITNEWSVSDDLLESQISSFYQPEISLLFEEPGYFIITNKESSLLNESILDGDFENFNDNWNYDNTLQNIPFETTYGITQGENGAYITGQSTFRVSDTVRAWIPQPIICMEEPDFYEQQNIVTGETEKRGNFLYADASSDRPEEAFTSGFAVSNYVWQQHFNVLQNTEYTFSLDLAQWQDGDAPTFMFLINGTPIETSVNAAFDPDTNSNNEVYYTLENSLCAWQPFTASFNTGQLDQVTLTIAEVSNQLQGHEFAIDNIRFNTGTTTTSTDYNIIVLSEQDCMITGTQTLESSEISVSPIPATDFITIESKHNLTSVLIFDQNGKTLITSLERRIDISSIPAGMYILAVSTTETTETFKLIIE